MIAKGEIHFAPLIAKGEIHFAPLSAKGEIHFAPLIANDEIHFAPLIVKGEINFALQKIPLRNYSGRGHPKNRLLLYICGAKTVIMFRWITPWCSLSRAILRIADISKGAKRP